MHRFGIIVVTLSAFSIASIVPAISAQKKAAPQTSSASCTKAGSQAACIQCAVARGHKASNYMKPSYCGGLK
jgi:hypothetical protein